MTEAQSGMMMAASGSVTRRRAALGVLATTLTPVVLIGQGAKEPPRDPPVAGLAITATVAHPSGDAEVILMVQSVAPDAYRITFSFDGPDGPSSNVVRRVLMNQRAARMMRNWYGESDPETFPGTTPFFSSAIIDDLRQAGRANLTLLVATSAATIGQTQGKELPGSVSQIESEPVGVRCL